MSDSKILIDRYEHLRQEILSKEIGSQLGLSVFLRQGMVGWIGVQSFLAATAVPSPVRRPEAVAPLPKGLAGELTRILAQWILNRKEFDHEYFF